MLSSDDAKYGGSGTELSPAKAKKEEMHGLPYSVELTLPPLSAVFYEHKAVRRAKAEDSAPAAEVKPKAVPKSRAKKADAQAEAATPKPLKKTASKAKAKAEAAVESKPKAPRKPRAKKTAPKTDSESK